MLNINLILLENAQNLGIPHYATEGSAGMDLRAAIADDAAVSILPGQRLLIATGIAIELPNGYNAEIRPRSGLAFKNGITVLNTPGTIDSDYRGEIMVLLYNASDQAFKIERGMRIAQMIVQKYERVNFCIVDNLEDTKRSNGGYGSTGMK